ncbi:SDR family NAD(P)-dependent oxidoreductase [Streptomyces sp. AS02]|uniref:SDR family NAD(P)-dependent oxidoreductase n=1 Tax=Streptomyces sp. AS02 TaxID=2938946 RepID=UPI002021088E|nr:SDR family oxidoreductase [Streptomyces sp. AS02]MCL8011267.1 SDR family oxidoreductase [Streptomyces sp. AS02]
MNTATDPSAAEREIPAMRRLDRRRIVITGAAAGIGRAVAHLFAREGAALVLLDRDADGLATTAAETGSTAFPLDITDEAGVASAAEQAASALGGIDGLVNCAGIMYRGMVADVPVEQWRRVLDVNLTGTYLVSRACLPWLREEAGSTIVNMASGQGLLPNSPGYTAYAASKGGIITLTRALAAELAPRVRVNSVCPGMVDTAMADGHRDNAVHYALKRLATPEEIAQVILFLTGGDSSYVTGAALAADGGRTFH